MNEEQALLEVKKALKTRRYEHTVRVRDEAQKLANQYHVNIEKARVAAILHDYAKYRSVEEMKQTIKDEKLDKRLLFYGNEILHAFVGATYVQKELGVDDEEIISAIRYHTTGRAQMTDIEKVVFLADYIEPGRTFRGVEEVREKAYKDLDHACFLALRNTVQFLVGVEKSIYPDTFEAYNDFAQKIKGGK
ncbi:bis(5'-nucleosyl)-tetraphosphatase (symmetrical) YqeK [Evansella cellulosilytica]|uniref:bis(5'-nucleosyl)-tetraphosphatase (symmetrical) n=1 Tax=Evansella cellulosilytica (strain ATCC 21833 / DSM 2522 / FERM P-1141 / JCM 9156 / N-4) TaxID=649639 RepID=E6TW11_EVAC2|nr:bis(5'-nucleosyl)-tetraphosphatase (symmetrical) YqeK [Evansella cellulosilytica]ADU29834.1 metal dependent phosphohydrolase [Evansella cellulosilytica DSM 2522]